eukprot:3847233-Prymnesium_polylepis.1
MQIQGQSAPLCYLWLETGFLKACGEVCVKACYFGKYFAKLGPAPIDGGSEAWNEARPDGSDGGAEEEAERGVQD